MFRRVLARAGALAVALTPLAAQTVVATVDPTQDRQPISPLIYGINYLTDPFGTVSSATISDLNASFVRDGGNLATRYNWQTNSENHAQDYYFESLPSDGANATDQRLSDLFIATVRNGGAEPTVTIPMIDWLSKLGGGGATLRGFSIATYGAQLDSNPFFPDAGNGLYDSGRRPDICTPARDGTVAGTRAGYFFENGTRTSVLSQFRSACAVPLASRSSKEISNISFFSGAVPAGTSTRSTSFCVSGGE